MIQEDVFQILSESAAIRSIVGSRIYPIKLPQGSSVPALVYSVEDISPISSLSGESGIDNSTLEIVCWSADYKTAHELAAAVRASFAASDSLITTINMQDIEDENTRNFGVLMNMSAVS
jgi:hypothetical protein